jgi:hypothetical protein
MGTQRKLGISFFCLGSLNYECAKQRAFKPEGENPSHTKLSQQCGTNICSVGSNEYIEAK